MTEQFLRKWVASVGWILICVVVFVALATALNTLRSGYFFLAAGAVTLLWFWLSVVRNLRGANWTIYRYFSVTHRTLLTLCIAVGILLGFAVVEEFLIGRIGVWPVLGIVGLAAHQFARGHALASRRWRSRADIYSSLQQARRQIEKGPLPRGYDYGFFVLASIASSMVGRFHGYQYPVLIAATLLALVVPFLVGVVVRSSRLLRLLVTEDEPLNIFR